MLTPTPCATASLIEERGYTAATGTCTRPEAIIAAEVQAPGWAYFAPQAAGSAWYPNPFTAPIESNEPYLAAALDMISETPIRWASTAQR